MSHVRIDDVINEAHRLFIEVTKKYGELKIESDELPKYMIEMENFNTILASQLETINKEFSEELQRVEDAKQQTLYARMLAIRFPQVEPNDAVALREEFAESRKDVGRYIKTLEGRVMQLTKDLRKCSRTEDELRDSLKVAECGNFQLEAEMRAVRSQVKRDLLAKEIETLEMQRYLTKQLSEITLKLNEERTNRTTAIAASNQLQAKVRELTKQLANTENMRQAAESERVKLLEEMACKDSLIANERRHFEERTAVLQKKLEEEQVKSRNLLILNNNAQLQIEQLSRHSMRNAKDLANVDTQTSERRTELANVKAPQQAEFTTTLATNNDVDDMIGNHLSLTFNCYEMFPTSIKNQRWPTDQESKLINSFYNSKQVVDGNQEKSAARKRKKSNDEALKENEVRKYISAGTSKSGDSALAGASPKNLSIRPPESVEGRGMIWIRTRWRRFRYERWRKWRDK